MADKDAKFHPNKSKVSANTMNGWKNNTVNGEIEQIPGAGPVTAKKLADAGFPNAYMLFGQYLLLKGPDEDSMDPSVHNEKFWMWLKSVGISAHRSAIVVAVAEKASAIFPDIYDPAAYDEKEKEEEEGN